MPTDAGERDFAPLIGALAVPHRAKHAYWYLILSGAPALPAVRRILADAGLSSAKAVEANRALFLHTFGFAAHEMALKGPAAASSAVRSAVERAAGKLEPGDLAAFAASLANPLETDREELFEFGLNCMLYGIGKQLRRQMH